MLSVPKWILIGSATLFSIIGIAAMMKKGGKPSIDLTSAKVVKPAIETPVISMPLPANTPMTTTDLKKPKAEVKTQTTASQPSTLPAKDDFPNIDRIFQLFTTGSSKLPIIETINYSSSVSWLKGRPAWVADYATYYNTSRHFIARSLNGKADYFSQKVSEGSKFNVFRKDKKIQFNLLVDVSRCKMGFYYVDLDTNERVLLKTYRVGLGRLDPSKPSGSLTPLGRYALGSKVAIYKPGTTGLYQEQKIEMIQVFGTRWLPLEESTGYGLHGAPWVDTKGQLMEKRDIIGTYDSNGCIILNSEDLEELFAIVLTKQTFVEVVKDFHQAKLPGVEVATPSR